MVVHGLAASIRAAEESEVFDLAGQSASTIQQTIRSAFEKPLSLENEEMIRITFVTGAGKLARSRYDDGAARAVTTVLKELGYEEDRGASCIVECAGTFKLQHDTGKNLKTVVVHPKVISSITNNNHTSGQAKVVESLVPENSPDYKIAVSSMAVFKNIVSNKCPSWTDKKGCLNCVGALMTLLQELDQKLIKGTQLDDSEQDFYDRVQELQEKQSYLKEEIQNQVETGNITMMEKQILLHLTSERMNAASSKQAKQKALKRKELLEQTNPIPYPPLKFQPQINKLRKELLPIYKLEQSAKGRLLTLKETQILAKKDEILQTIEQHELSSRGWFEDETTFQARVQQSRSNAVTQKSSNKKKSVPSSFPTNTSSSSVPGVNKWVTPGQSPATTYKNNYSLTKKKKLKGPDVFNAMMMDSSSDEEESDIEEVVVTQKITQNMTKETKPKIVQKPMASKKNPTTQKKKMPTATSKETKGQEQTKNLTDASSSGASAVERKSPTVTSDEKKTSKKKKKKKKSKKNNVSTEADDEVTTTVANELIADDERRMVDQSEKEEYSSGVVIVVFSLLLRLIKEILLPLVVAIMTWIIGFLFGKPKKKKLSSKNR